MESCKVNIDVIFLILSCLDSRADISALTRTCQALHQAGAPYLFHQPIDLDYGFNLASFHSYMFADPISRSPLLKNITISSYPFAMDNSSDLFMQIMGGSAPSMTNLTIVHTGDFIDHQPGFSKLAPRFQSLTVLNMDNCDEAALKIIDHIAAPLKEVHLGLNWRYADDNPTDPRNLLSGFSSTLQYLKVSRMRFEDTIGAHFPHVHTLITSLVEFPMTDTLVTSFPNLRHYTAGYSDYLHKVEGSRTANALSNHKHGWKDLECLKGDIWSLYVTALASPVPVMIISPPIQPSSIRELHGIVQDASPSAVAMAVHILRLESIGELIVQGTNPRLTKLHLKLLLHPSLLTDMAGVLTALADVFKLCSSPLEYLCIDITYKSCKDHVAEAGKFDLNDFIHALGSNVLPIRHIVAKGSFVNDAMRGWKVDGGSRSTSDSVRAEELSASAALDVYASQEFEFDDQD